ncbi:MAG: ribonuclease P protein component 1 [Candidatus Methanomethylophilaceae archaeon]|jgi:ribonuclease P protein subunit POP4
MKRAEIVRAELIGLEVTVLSAPYSGIAGRVVDETKNTFVIESAGSEKMVPKPGNVFRFVTEEGTADLNGSDILFRPEDRIKKAR